MITLSILIPTIPQRKELLAVLQDAICVQMADYINATNSERKYEHKGYDLRVGGFSKTWHNEIEIIVNGRLPPITTGAKRNELLKMASGKYVWFIDDDDMIMPGAINAIMEAAKTDCDCMAVNGIMTTDGQQEIQWYIALGNPYCADFSTGKEVYLRYPNHITPMKRELALQCQFPDQNNFEDKAWADCLKAKDILKTETKIEIPVYHYRYSTIKKSY